MSASLDPNVSNADTDSVWVVNITLNAEGARTYGKLSKNAVASCSEDCPERHVAWWLGLTQDDIDHWNERAGVDYQPVDEGGKLMFDPRMGAPVTGQLFVGDYTALKAHRLVRLLGGK